VHFALHLPLSVGFRLRRLVMQRAVDGGQAGRGVAKVAAFRERGHERQPVVAGGGRGAPDLVRRSDPQAAVGAAAGAGAGALAAPSVAGAAAAAGRSPRSPSLPVSDRDFSSFIIGDGATTASVLATTR